MSRIDLWCVVGAVCCAGCSNLVYEGQTSPPEVEILFPANGDRFSLGEAIRFVATVSDDQDPVDALSAELRSDIDGDVGAGTPGVDGLVELSPGLLAAGEHVMVLSVTDTDGAVGMAAVGIVIAEPGSGGESSGGGPGVDPDTGESTRDTGSAGTSDPPDTGAGTGVSPDDSAVDSGVPPLDSGVLPPDTGSPSAGLDTGVVPPDCAPPVVWERVTHGQGAVDLRDVEWAPDGSYALILGYPAVLLHYEPTTSEVTLVAEASDEFWHQVAFAPDSSYALIGASTDDDDPLLYHYTPADGVVAMPDIVGTGSGKLLSTPYRVRALHAHPSTGEFVLFGDNHAAWPSQLGCINTLTPDFVGGAHEWGYHGCASIDQGADSVAWGENLGQPIAVGVSHYLELLYFDPALATGQVTASTHGSTGNLKTVRFDPTDPSVAWVLGWSGSSVYTWQSSLLTGAADSHHFSGGYLWDFDVSSDGRWKLFVGREANAFLSDSPFRPMDDSRFYDADIPSWDLPPWSGTNNDYLWGVSWRPDTCEGLVVGDATSNQGTIARFSLQ